ncbi:protease m50 membrane-bound transcription factor site 2 protease [Anaeramoeba flamelloides]|uniref:Protease m50 membrane-bound transcription factor site 2 protease n=1 Tax=Anaeramoeba flamelloides TaxID=1746091 RepID=A0ABQ8Y8Q9_9EUKA|nr:protease m50 membrane-bound transcription factor site 2 protease [Anaeramoeba flamelloides]
MTPVLYEPTDGAIITSVQATHFQKMISVGDCVVRLNDCEIKNSQDIYKCLEKINPKKNNLEFQNLEDYEIETKFSTKSNLDSQKMQRLNGEGARDGINNADDNADDDLINTNNKKTIISKQQKMEEIKRGAGGDDFLIITLDSGKQLKVYVNSEMFLKVLSFGNIIPRWKFARRFKILYKLPKKIYFVLSFSLSIIINILVITATPGVLSECETILKIIVENNNMSNSKKKYLKILVRILKTYGSFLLLCRLLLILYFSTRDIQMLQ